MSNTPSNAIPYVPQNTLDPAAGLNDAIRVIDALLNTRVISMTLTAPPGSPADGDMYIVAAGATGAWATHDNAVAQYTATGAFWTFFAAGDQAWLILNRADGNLYKWNAGTSHWELAAGIGEAPLDGNYYGRQSGTWAEMPNVSEMVTSVNGQAPDTSGNVEIELPSDGVQSINGQTPDTSGNVNVLDNLSIAASDETTGIAATITAAAKFRNPYSSAFNAVHVKASLSTAQATGSLFTVDILVNGVSMLSTLLTFDNTESTTETATTAAVISNPVIAADAEITIAITQVGDGTAAGLKVYILGMQ